MTKEELEKEAEELIQRFEMANSMNCFMQLTPDRKQMGEMLVMIAEPREKRIADLEKENAGLKAKVGLSIDCEKAQKNGELCLGYGCDEDEPCEQCKNCIKCEGGYYQLGETEKDEQFAKAKELLRKFLEAKNIEETCVAESEAEQFLKEVQNDR